MAKQLVRKKCKDCSTQAGMEAVDEIVDKLREILKTPEGVDIIQWAKGVIIVPRADATFLENISVDGKVWTLQIHRDIPKGNIAIRETLLTKEGLDKDFILIVIPKKEGE